MRGVGGRGDGWSARGVAQERSGKFRVVGLIRCPGVQVDVPLAFQPGRCSLRPRPSCEDGDVLAVVAPLGHVGGHDIALVPDAAGSSVGLTPVVWSADDEDEVIFANLLLHEGGELVAQSRVPLVQPRFDAISAEVGGQLGDPRFVAIVVPGIGDENPRWRHGGGVFRMG